MSAFLGSTAIFSKYHPRPHNALSPDIFVHVAPPSSDRYSPPCDSTPGAAPARPPPAPPRPGGAVGVCAFAAAAARPCPGGGSGAADGGIADVTVTSITAYTR